MFPDDARRLQQSCGMSVSVACGADGAGVGNRPLVLELVAALEPVFGRVCDSNRR